MTSNTGAFRIDMKDCFRNIERVLRRVPDEDARQGLFFAANALLHDGIYIQPFAPFDEGHLRASARVKNIVVTYSSLSVDCGFNIAYAARWHELAEEKAKYIHWTLPGSGPKYLEIKMSTYKEHYYSIVANAIQKKLEGG